MKVYFIGNDDNEYGLKYGDEVDLSPAYNNEPEFELFIVEINGEKHGVTFKDLCEDFTSFDGDVIYSDIPVKPEKYEGKYCCGQCGSVISEYWRSPTMEYCEECGQRIDWSEE